jgi:protein phosphatase
MFDFVGDVHGCTDELQSLLTRLGYIQDIAKLVPYHPSGRKMVFVGDLIDRGPDSVGTLRIAMRMVLSGSALAVTGNHDDKLRRYLNGNKVKPKHGLQETINQLEKEPEWFRDEISDFLDKLPYRLMLDEGKVMVCHAGLPASMHECVESGKVRSHALYGDVDGTTDHDGFPVRKDWTKDYRGTRIVVHGHVPVKEPDIRNNVYNLDTGCCFGNKLTALRYPEMEIVSIPAFEAYSTPRW